MHFVVFALDSGEIEESCPYCGIYAVSEKSAYMAHPIPFDHGKYILKEEEKDIIHEISESRYKYKVDWNKRKITSS